MPEQHKTYWNKCQVCKNLMRIDHARVDGVGAGGALLRCKVFGLDRIAVMAALNIANEFLANKGQAAQVTELMDDRVTNLTERIAAALAEQKQLNL